MSTIYRKPNLFKGDMSYRFCNILKYKFFLLLISDGLPIS
ncbi:hypothetical protein NEICINOT_04143 [Neisseria cinerea ATCC 14685]|uniref:Uncharacterized protein n=1 Tax=Neisseria cinerea ATCC 14685 TaxID=546262 RepID=D0W3A6_NEICI|nr:hypothetical protein NEICINOT_04143 [Neisseria cinerea ATCC 14685]